MISSTEEHALIRRARRGDGSAIEALIQAHQAPLYGFMLRMSGNPEAAADVVQESFVRVLTHLDRFDERFRFSTWLFTIAKRLYVNSIHKRAPVFDSGRVEGRPSGGDGPGNQAMRSETLDVVRGVLDEALATLNAQQREIILLFHQQNWSIRQVAEHLDMPEGTIKSHLHRARKRMRQAIVSTQRLHRRAQEVLT